MHIVRVGTGLYTILAECCLQSEILAFVVHATDRVQDCFVSFAFGGFEESCFLKSLWVCACVWAVC